MKYILAEKIIEKIKFKRDHCDPNMKRRAGYDAAIAMIEREQCGTLVRDVVARFQEGVNSCSSVMVLRGEELLVISKHEYLAVINRLKAEEAAMFRRLETVDTEENFEE